MITLTKPIERKGWRSLGAVIWLIDRETVLGLSSRLSDASSVGVLRLLSSPRREA
jgi:hypothetical protein